MKEETKNRIETLFEGLDDSLIKTDPECVDIVVNFSQEEVMPPSLMQDPGNMDV